MKTAGSLTTHVFGPIMNKQLKPEELLRQYCIPKDAKWITSS
jgi:hypothetical protein